MPSYTQANRHLQVVTPLGTDQLLLRRFHGEEGISQLFRFDLQMYSENHGIRFDELVGKKATISVTLPDGSMRYINGIISSFSQGGTSPLENGTTPTVFTTYHATLVPWLWMLTRSSDCRIFQHLTVPDIIAKVFKEVGFSDFSNRLYGNFEPREYCVQYRETDFNFVSRLMEEEGIFYFFEHTADKHTLVLANRSSEFKPSPLNREVGYSTLVGPERDANVITDWTQRQEVRPGQYTLTDFDFEKPSFDLTAAVNGKGERKLELYDYPGLYREKAQGERLVGIRMEEEQTTQVSISGSSTCRGFTPGYRFDLVNHYRRDFNQSYVLTTVYHTADHGANYRSGAEAGAESFVYTNHFQCIPHSTPFRPPRVTPVPVVHGSQTAVVVGPAGEEIYPDPYGRVKVQFHWDRQGKRDENSSCWIRVSHPWAGKGWGAISIPRIGQEVVVDFLEGHPDHPLITGRVYNARQMPPFGLPGSMTVSGIKSNTHKGSGYNEFSMDDTAGQEKITIHGQYDMNTTVEHDQTSTVHNNRTDQIDVDDSETVGGNQTQTIGVNQTQTVGGNQTETVVQNRTRTVNQNETVTVFLTRTHTVGINEMITVGGAQEITVGGLQMITVGAAQQTTVGLSQSTDVIMSRSVSVGRNNTLNVGKNITIDAGDQILIKTGKASILMKKDGSIKLNGKDILVAASGKIVKKAKGNIVMKGRRITEN
ncbi:MAG TPA: type VI secretion system tip protein TssI/VgrG [Blastocatellia bacterium]|nr:type VI secretion system tip protein TssI/VgrG [Blastocatellia bacterium]